METIPIHMEELQYVSTRSGFASTTSSAIAGQQGKYSHIAQSDVAHSLEVISMEELDSRSSDTIGTTLMMKFVALLDVSKKMNKDTNLE